MEEKMTIYDENLRLHRQAKELEMVRNMVIHEIETTNYASDFLKTLCVMMDIDYNDILGKEAKA